MSKIAHMRSLQSATNLVEDLQGACRLWRQSDVGNSVLPLMESLLSTWVVSRVYQDDVFLGQIVAGQRPDHGKCMYSFSCQ
jgi:hypothetical protein